MQSVKKEFEFANDNDFANAKYTLVEYAYMFCAGCMTVTKMVVQSDNDD